MHINIKSAGTKLISTQNKKKFKIVVVHFRKLNFSFKFKHFQHFKLVGLVHKKYKNKLKKSTSFLQICLKNATLACIIDNKPQPPQIKYGL
jgi:carbonic anhydrase